MIYRVRIPVDTIIHQYDEAQAWVRLHYPEAWAMGLDFGNAGYYSCDIRSLEYGFTNPRLAVMFKLMFG